MWRKVLWLIAGCCLIVLSASAIFHIKTSSGPFSPEVIRIGIAPYYEDEEAVYIVGRYLNCAPSPDQAWDVSCTIEILGQPLEIRARRNPTGQCIAFYTDKQWLCRIVWASEPVPWSAYLDEPLGLNKDQLTALHREYLLKDSLEYIFLDSIMLFSISNALLLLMVMGLWLRSLVRHKTLGAMLVTTCVLATWGISFFAGVLLTNIFWD